MVPDPDTRTFSATVGTVTAEALDATSSPTGAATVTHKPTRHAPFLGRIVG
jgi:hypothetical protein